VNSNDPFRPAHHGVAPGTRLNGIYEIDRMIGAGGMGEVYRSHEIQTGTAVAIKMLLPDMADNEAALALFRKEASALHYLMHDAIVRYFVFTIEPVLQRPYLAMEFVDGQSLSEILAAGPLAADALQRLTRRVAAGLHAAHQRGIIHRDVSPDNIIVPEGNVSRAKIIDFGIARTTQLGEGTIIGSGFAGKHNYVSPEQIGLFGGDVTAKSDIYSLGLVLYQALTGQKLDMGGSQFQLVEKRRQLPDLSAVNAAFRPLLERMLQPDPRDRPASMAEIENWNFGASDRPKASPRNSGAIKSNAGIEERAQPKARGPLRRYGVIAFATLLVAATATAGYEYFWDVPIAPPPLTNAPSLSPAAPSLNPGPAITAPVRPPADTTNAPPPSLAPSESKGPSVAAPADASNAAPPGPSPSQNPGPAIAAPVKPPADAPLVTPGGAGRDGVARFIEQYNGGDCFLIMPVALSDSAAVLEGFGASATPFEVLDQAFQKTQGFEASIGVRLVAQPQCPAISFLYQLRANRARAPRITLGSVGLRPGEVLVGTIENFANRTVELLLVSNSGVVKNVSSALKQGTDALSFTLELPRLESGSSGKSPQLVMAVASPRVVDALRRPDPIPADQFFPQILSEAQRSAVTLTASARYFTIERP
jgi:serine/threonine-protein kinase